MAARSHVAAEGLGVCLCLTFWLSYRLLTLLQSWYCSAFVWVVRMKFVRLSIVLVLVREE